MATVIDSLLVSLGFQVKPEGLQDFAKLTERAKTGMLAIGVAAGVAFEGIEHLFHGAATRLGGIKEFSDQMGISTRTVAALGEVADENGSSLEGMEGGLRGLTMMAIQADRKLGRGAMVFKTFGLEARDSNHHLKSAEVLLGEVADKMEKLKTPGERNLLGSRMGFDPEMVELLSKGRANLEALRQESEQANPFGEKDYEAALQAERGFRKAGAAVTLLRDRIAVQLFPAVNEMLAKFVAWTKDPEKIRTIARYMKDVVEVAKWITQHFGTILKVAGALTALKVGMWFFGLASDIGKTSKALIGLIRGFGVLRLTLMTGILGALVLLGQDLWVFHQGGISLTGWMVNKFPGGVDVMVAALDVLGGAFLGLAAGSGPVGLAAIAIGGFVIAGLAIKDAWTPLMQWIEDKWDSVANKLRTVAKILSWPVWLVLRVLGGKEDVDYVYGKDRDESPKGIAKTLADANEYNRKMEDMYEVNNRHNIARRFNERFNKAPQVSLPDGSFDMTKEGGFVGLGQGMPAMTGNMLSWGRGAMGAKSTTVHTETHVGAVHVHVKGGEKWTPKDALNHAQEIKRALALEGLMSRDQNRVNTHNAQPATGL